MSDFEPKPDNLNYAYRGIPLTPTIVQNLIIKLFGGKLVERKILVDEVVRFHLAGGGLKASAENPKNTFDKAFKELSDKGTVENISPGYWRIHQSKPAEEISPTAPGEPFSASETAAPESSMIPESTADIEVGEGAGAVYIYYLPTYQLRAQEQGERAWPCKIGRTDRDPLSRVLAQAATALPERPRIAIIIRTSYPSAWESALHSVLTLRGLRIENVPGVSGF